MESMILKATPPPLDSLAPLVTAAAFEFETKLPCKKLLYVFTGAH